MEAVDAIIEHLKRMSKQVTTPEEIAQVCSVSCLVTFIVLHCGTSAGICGMEGAGLVPWVGGHLDVLFLFYLLKEAFQSQTNTEKILYNESRWALISYRN